jgi:outer membrane protein
MFRTKQLIVLLLAAPFVLGAQQPSAIPPVQAMHDTTFHAIPLAQAVRLARENNVQNIEASNTVRTANNGVRSARAQILPTLSASTGQVKSAGQRAGPSGTLIPIVSQWQYTTGLSSNVTLFDAGIMFADIRAARANVDQAQATQVNTEFNVDLSVKQAYNAVLAAKESEDAALAQLATAQAQLQTSIAKVNAGASTVSDSLRSIVAVGDAQLAVLTAQNTFRTQSAALTRLVGTTYFVTADLADTVEHQMTMIDSSMVMQLALNGPTIRAADAGVASASAAERSAKAAYLPTLGASFNFGGSGAGALYGLNSNPFPYSRSLSLAINYQVFNRYTRENNLAAAQISMDNAQAQTRDAKLAAQQNIVTDIAALRNAEETIRVQEQNVRASEEDLRVVQQRYNLGASVLLDVLTSQQTLVNARQQLIQARLNYRDARAQIESVIGRDLP